MFYVIVGKTFAKIADLQAHNASVKIKYLNPVCLSGVPKGSILGYFMFYVIVGKPTVQG